MSGERSTSTRAGGGGSGVVSVVLTIVFVVLKLTGVIGWSWLWVLSPIWIGAALWVLIFVIAFVVEAARIDRAVRRRLK